MNNILNAVQQERRSEAIRRERLESRESLLAQIEALAVQLNNPEFTAGEKPEGPTLAEPCEPTLLPLIVSHVPPEQVRDEPKTDPAPEDSDADEVEEDPASSREKPETQRESIDRRLFEVLRTSGPQRGAQLLARPDVPWMRATVYSAIARLRAAGLIEISTRSGPGPTYRATPGGPLPGPKGYVAPKPIRVKDVEARRQRLFEYVAEHPGCTPADIRRDVGTGVSMTSKDLLSLRDAHRIQRLGDGNGVRYWTTEAMDAKAAAQSDGA